MRISDWSSECALPISALQTPDGKPGLLARYYNPVTPPPAQFQPGEMAQQLAAIRYQDTPVVSRVEPDVGLRDLDLAKVAHHHLTVCTGFPVPPATGTYGLGPSGSDGTLKSIATPLVHPPHAPCDDPPHT